MAPKFSLQNVLDIRHEKVEILEIELGKLSAIHQETRNLMNSLKEYQSSLLDQLNETQTGEIDMVKLNLLRLNILQVSKHIEIVMIELKTSQRDRRKENVSGSSQTIRRDFGNPQAQTP